MSADPAGAGTGAGTGGSEEDHEPVGSLGAEAVRLLAALQDWAAESGAEHAATAAGAAAGAADALHDVAEHLATGAASCTYCPVCRLVTAVRATSPEVRGHLRAAASSLLQAAAALMATPAPDRPGDGGAARSHVDDEREGG